ncbi:DUF5994 family protein [Prescottella agglutinans]|uniref:DUF5994 family protein n=1 Tax=Prescottella agglutinans TaxID=1644129 RepID=UPI000FDEE2E7|nr:DUF5994 family protein [Prescottella agglutinans]
MTRPMTRMDPRVPLSDGFQPFPIPTRTPRLVLRGHIAGSGQVCGWWWPWTENLTVQIHGLISALTPQTGPIESVAFDWNTISTRQRRTDAPDGVRFVSPLPGQAAGVMCLIGTDHRGTFLTVIPSNAQP